MRHHGSEVIDEQIKDPLKTIIWLNLMLKNDTRRDQKIFGLT